MKGNPPDPYCCCCGKEFRSFEVKRHLMHSNYYWHLECECGDECE